MKRLFICALALTSCAFSYGQKNIPPFIDYLKGHEKFNTPSSPVLKSPDIKMPQLNKFTLKEVSLKPAQTKPLSYVKPTGNKIILLPQDNMSCVVPDISRFNMPVVISADNIDEKIYADK